MGRIDNASFHAPLSPQSLYVRPSPTTPTTPATPTARVSQQPTVPGANNENDHYEALLRTTVLNAADGVFSYTPANLVASPFRERSSGGDASSSSRLLARPSQLSPSRRIPTHPAKVLDAPALADDFYLSLIDWGATNVLAVGLNSEVYLWNASNAKVTKLFKDSQPVCSVVWSPCGNYLAFSDNDGHVSIVDVATQSRVHKFKEHSGRVGCMSWHGTVLATGSRDCTVKVVDTRMRQLVRSWANHQQEVCGLAWSHCGRYLACGGNDNKLMVWAANHDSTTPLHLFTDHTSAVRGLAWSPHSHGLLASGGGSQDRCIRIWNVKHASSSSLQGHVDTGSQVCALAWAHNVDEIVSTHGFSQYSVNLWKVNSSPFGSANASSFGTISMPVGSPVRSPLNQSPSGSPSHWPVRPQPISVPESRAFTASLDSSSRSLQSQEILTPIASIFGHTTRVLYLTMSPDGETICTGAGDETLRFWNVFPPKKKAHPASPYAKLYSPLSSGGPYGSPRSPLWMPSTEFR
eukprot:ANDGO_02712.mRNA.1 Protein FIZZY-RELATED 2